MTIDFSALCLAPQMAIFGRQVTVTPLVSQPLGAPYATNGIVTVTSVSIPTDDGGFLSSVALKLGIRIADCAVPPRQGDWISTEVANLPLGYWQGTIDPTINLDFSIFDTTPDGQGGMTRVLVASIRAPSPYQGAFARAADRSSLAMSGALGMPPVSTRFGR